MRPSREDELKGEVTEALPNAEFRVLLENGVEKRCYLAGKIKMNRVRILVGDKVKVIDCGEIGRITWRV